MTADSPPGPGRKAGAEHPRHRSADDPVYAATNVLFAHRHTLPNDILRSLADIWTCASAARFGQPYETWWIDEPSLYTEHDTAECEAEDLRNPEPWEADPSTW